MQEDIRLCSVEAELEGSFNSITTIFIGFREITSLFLFRILSRKNNIASFS